MIAPNAPPLILASTSAARSAVLTAAGLPFTTHSPPVDEAPLKTALHATGQSPDATALALADAKAASIAAPDALVIGADQLLTCDGHWFSKPHDLAEARTHLERLRGRPHTLHTAVTCWRGGKRRWQHTAHPRLTMRPFSDAFLDAYLAAEGDALLACVGCYRLEGLGAHLFEAVEGEAAAVLGLPLLPLLAFLRGCGVLMA